MIGRAVRAIGRAIGRAARGAVRRVHDALLPPIYEDELPIPVTWRDGESSPPPSTPTEPAVPSRMPGRKTTN